MTLDSLVSPKALLAWLFFAGAAYGGAQLQIASNAKGIAEIREAQKQQQQMKEQAARIDERTRAIREEQQRQRQMLEELLRRER